MDTVTGGPYEVLGEAIRKAGYEDSSGLRRYLLRLLQQDALIRLGVALNISTTEAYALRQMFNGARGEP